MSVSNFYANGYDQTIVKNHNNFIKYFEINIYPEYNLNERKIFKNIRLKNLTSFKSIKLKIGNIIIIEIFDFMYEFLSKLYSLNTHEENLVVIPNINFPLPFRILHSDRVQLIVEIEEFYDISKIKCEYDIHSNPDKIEQQLFFNPIFRGYQFFNQGKINRINLACDGYVRYVASNVPDGIDVNFDIYMWESEKKILVEGVEIIPLYRIGQFMIYEFPHLNFDKLSEVKMVVDDRVNKMSDLITVFVVNIKSLEYSNGKYNVSDKFLK
jgi:hypothetical protein